MINEKELNISSMSYINKDFQAIYPELLDLIKSLTNRWDPASSNESDPGVVLLKIGAFLADHLNYNIDKNVLECFLPSATQEDSVRYIAEFGGYTPRYYRSAIGDVNVTYNPKVFDGSFRIPAFSLVISNNDGSITYTQIEDIEILNKNIPATGKFIEGTVQKLSVDSDVITLKNLDNNNRLYFPTQYVAENGVYIWNVQNGQASSSLWTKTNYLYTRPQGTRCYKIDFDSKRGLPYIEFPSDIANLIGNGLMVNYIYTAGSYGNVKAGELDTVVSLNSAALGFTLDTDDLVITNSASINSGAEPETIEEIYRNYKKVVGTFDTLVTLNDYTNAINLATDNYGQKLISNGVVTDRRVDYNNAINIVTNTTLGTISKNEPIGSFGKLSFKGTVASLPAEAVAGEVYTLSDTGEPMLCIKASVGTPSESGFKAAEFESLDKLDYEQMSDYFSNMSPYNLIIYALQKYSEIEYNSIYYWQALNNSYRQIPSQDPEGDDIDNIEDLLIADIEKYKCINHVFSDLENGQVYCFKNYLPLNITIVPFNKVNTYERAEIINNIRKCISDNFNASKINFGEEINYDELKRAVENCDERINYVNIADFEYNTKVMLKSEDPNDPARNEKSLFDAYEGVTFIADLAAKNVLSGRLCLFDFDENFEYQYGQTACKAHTEVNAIQTSLKLLNAGESGGLYSYNYTLKENEYFEIITPKYYSEKTFGSYVLFNATLDEEIAAGVEHTLAENEHIDLYYKDSKGNIYTPTIKAGETILASFTLKPFNSDTSYTYEKDTEIGVYKQIASNESISTRVLMSTEFNTNKYVYWITNTPNNILFDVGEKERILSDNEFFIYTDSTKQYLTILGRGTKLIRQVSTSKMELPATVENKAIRQRMADEGLAADIPFELINFSGNSLTIIRTNITVLGEGNNVKFKTSSANIDFNLSYANDIRYTIDGNETILPPQGNFYQVRTRLDINMSSESPQVLTADTYGTQTIAIRSGTTTTQIVGQKNSNTYLRSNVDLNLIGNVSNEPIDLSIYADFDVSINILQYELTKCIKTSYRRTNIQMPSRYNGWGISIDGQYKYFSGAVSPEDQQKYYVAESVNESVDIPSIIDCSVPCTYSIPYSTIWYDYLEDSLSTLNRQYISELYYSNPETVDGQGNIRVGFEIRAIRRPGGGYVDQYSRRAEIGYYGLIGDKVVSGATNSDRYILNNKSVYIYPVIVKEDLRHETVVNLVLNISPVQNSYITLSPLKVVWDVNDYGTGLHGAPIISRINDILDKTGSHTQFHWTNVPSNEMALSNDNLVDPYSFFDKNNVANIITIPQIDLENSTIEVIKSMRK